MGQSPDPPTPEPSPAAAAVGPAERPAQRVRSDWRPLYIIAAASVALACSWYLLKELAPLLRPLVLAIFLCYVILPLHIKLCRHVHTTLSVVILSATTLLLIFGLGAMIYGSIISLNDDLPRLIRRAQDLWSGIRTNILAKLPKWLTESATTGEAAAQRTTDQIRSAVLGLVNSIAQWLGEFLLLSFYLVFLLAEARHLPHRIKAGFTSESGRRLLEVGTSINKAMSSYLRVKVIASLIMAIPAGLILWLFGVRFAGMWTVLVFVGNFIPYVGSIFAFLLPVSLAFLELEPLWKPVTVLALLSINQFVNNNVIEPRLTARALDVSPVIVLMALSYWGLAWGVTGMLLAVPLTVMLKVVCDRIPITRPLARVISQS
jgi:AI-2 transport protein TqsA